MQHFMCCISIHKQPIPIVSVSHVDATISWLFKKSFFRKHKQLVAVSVFLFFPPGLKAQCLDADWDDTDG